MRRLFAFLLYLYALSAQDESLCYGNCNNNGRCVNFMCICYVGWYGESCSLQYSKQKALANGYVLKTERELTEICKSLDKDDIMVIGASSSSCAECDKVEPEYQSFMSLINDFSEDLEGKKIVFNRLDALKPEFKSFMEDIGVNYLPCVLIFIDNCKVRHVFRAESKAETLMRYVINLFNAKYVLVNNFDKLNHELHKWRPFVKTLGIHFLVARSETELNTSFPEELMNHMQAINSLYLQEHMKFFIITEEVTQYIQSKFAPIVKNIALISLRVDLTVFEKLLDSTRFVEESFFAYFETIKINRAISTYFAEGAEMSILDLASNDFNVDATSYRNFYISRSVPVGASLTPDLFPRFELYPRPMVMLFYRNPEESNYTNPSVFKTFRKVAEEMIDSYYFVTADYFTFMEQAARMFIFLLPGELGVSINDVSGLEIEPIIYEKSTAFKIGAVRNLLKNHQQQRLPKLTHNKKIFLKNKQREVNRLLAKQTSVKSRPLKVNGDHNQFDSTTDGIISITTSNLKFLILQEDSKDVCIFFYDTSSTSAASIPHFKNVVKRFNELGIPHLSFYRWDRSSTWLPAEFLAASQFRLPCLVLLPAFQRPVDDKFLFKRFSEEFRTASIMRWLQKHTYYKFTLPDLPQFNDNQRLLYKQQIRERERKKEEL